MLAEAFTTGRRPPDPASAWLILLVVAALVLDFTRDVFIALRRYRKARRKWEWEGSPWEKANGLKPFSRISHDQPQHEPVDDS